MVTTVVIPDEYHARFKEVVGSRGLSRAFSAFVRAVIEGELSTDAQPLVRPKQLSAIDPEVLERVRSMIREELGAALEDAMQRLTTALDAAVEASRPPEGEGLFADSREE